VQKIHKLRALDHTDLGRLHGLRRRLIRPVRDYAAQTHDLARHDLSEGDALAFPAGGGQLRPAGTHDKQTAGKFALYIQQRTLRVSKASKPTEFGNMVQIQEAENQIITVYEVFAQRPWGSDLLAPAVESHQQQFGRAPRLVAADAAFYSKSNEDQLHEMGVRRVAVPNRHTRSEERKQLQRRRWFKAGQRWRTGCEGRISVLKRRHGLSRCRYRGLTGIQRWVGLGVIADNLVSMGTALARA
jgi:IS5 family transposase